VSFGDTFSFCLENYHKIKNSNKRILTKSTLEHKIVKFFFPNKCSKLFFSIPMLIPFYSINNLLNNNQYFKNNINKNYLIKDDKIKSSQKTRELIENLIESNSKKVSQNIKKFNKKKYILMHIKYYNTDKNDLRFSYPRATSNLEKIFKIIEYLNKKKITVVVLGDSYDKSVKILKNKINNNVLFFEDLSKNQSIIDQMYIHYYSSLCIGNPGGSFIISMYLQKKIIFFDSLINVINKYPMMYGKNITNLYKKITIKNKTNFLSDKYIKNFKEKNIEKINYQIIESSYEDIKKSLSKYI